MLGKNIIKKSIALIAFASIMMQSFSYAAKNPFERQEFDAPTAEKKTKTSEATIKDPTSYKEYSPVNPVPAGVNKEEYDSVDNFNISFNTLDSRIKYFSPTYLNIKDSAKSSLYSALYMKGGSDISRDVFKKTLEDVYDSALDLRKSRDDAKSTLRDMIKKGTSTEAEINAMKLEIGTYDAYYKATMDGYNSGLKTIHATELMLGHATSRAKAANVDKYPAVSAARRQVTSAMKGALLSYLKLDYTLRVLQEQEVLNKFMYDTYLRNFKEGTATALEVSSKLSAYEKSKITFKTTYNLYMSVKEQICINLGYNLEDINNLKIEEPEVDVDYITHINVDEDRQKAYNSNQAYSGIHMSSKDMKFPGSTGEAIYNKKREYMANKVIIAFEDTYQKLQAAIWTYDGGKYLDEITQLNDRANDRKKDNNLVSEVEYKALKLQNVAYKLEVRNAKYDLIQATIDYQEATMGNLNI